MNFSERIKYCLEHGIKVSDIYEYSIKEELKKQVKDYGIEPTDAVIDYLLGECAYLLFDGISDVAKKAIHVQLYDVVNTVSGTDPIGLDDWDERALFFMKRYYCSHGELEYGNESVDESLVLKNDPEVVQAELESRGVKSYPLDTALRYSNLLPSQIIDLAYKDEQPIDTNVVPESKYLEFDQIKAVLEQKDANKVKKIER